MAPDGAGGRGRSPEGHRPRRRSGCDGCLRVAGLHGRQADRAAGLRHEDQKAKDDEQPIRTFQAISALLLARLHRRSPHPEIMLGGGEKKTLRLVARYGAACNLFATSGEEVAHKLDVLRRHCDEAERDYDAIRRTVTYSGAAATEEDLSTFTRDIEPYTKLGIDTVIISPHMGATSRWMETLRRTRSATAARTGLKQRRESATSMQFRRGWLWKHRVACSARWSTNSALHRRRESRSLGSAPEGVRAGGVLCRSGGGFRGRCGLRPPLPGGRRGR